MTFGYGTIIQHSIYFLIERLEPKEQRPRITINNDQPSKSKHTRVTLQTMGLKINSGPLEQATKTITPKDHMHDLQTRNTYNMSD